MTLEVLEREARLLGIYQCRREHPKTVARVFKSPQGGLLVILFCKWCCKDKNFQDYVDQEFLDEGEIS